MGYLGGSLPSGDYLTRLLQQKASADQYQQLYLAGLQNSVRGMLAASQMTVIPAPKPLYSVWRPTPEDARCVKQMEALIGLIDLWRRVPIIGKWRASKFADQLEALVERMERHVRFLGFVLFDASADHPQPE